MIETRADVYALARKEGHLQYQSREGSMVTDHARRLFAWGFTAQTIADLLNDQLLSVNKHGASPVKVHTFHKIDADSRGLRSTERPDADVFEQAALVLARFDQGEFENQRARIIVDILYSINQRLTYGQIEEEIGVDRSFITCLLAEARRELEDDDRFHDEIREIYMSELGTARPEEAPSRKMVLVYRRMYPLYVAFRESVGDEPGCDRYGNLSHREVRILELIAGGADYGKVADDLGLPYKWRVKYRYVSASYRALADPDFGLTRGRSELSEEYGGLVKVLDEIAFKGVWKQYFKDISELHEHIGVLNALQRSLPSACQKYGNHIAREAVVRARAVAKNYSRGQPTLRRRRGR